MSFTVYGTPQPAGSKRAFPIRRSNGKMGASVVDANPKSASWKTVVSQTAAVHFRGDLLGGALEVVFNFVLARPKGHYGKRGLLPSAPEFPTGKPDVLKLSRGVEDALSGIVWRDDALIVDERLSKRYGETAGVGISIRELSAGMLAPPSAPARPATAGQGAATSGRGAGGEAPGGIAGEREGV
ncbi:MAG: RusA family crossover junction endodeoxyribonuclease [Pseudomonadota bacterium]|nr:RusA family crossover junction endodeoxyribonuclease [Pseudomonadota bacterium]